MSMKNNRESLDKKAQELRAKLGLEESMHPVDVFAKNVNTEWDKFITFVSEGHSDDEEKAALKPVNNALGFYHEELLMERLEQLKAMKSAEADAEYLRCQCIIGFTAKKDKEAGWQLVNKVKKQGKEVPVYVRLTAYDFVNFVHPVEANGIMNLCTIIAENMAVNKIGSAGISRKDFGFSPAYQTFKEKLAEGNDCWKTDDGKLSNTKLSKQLMEIWKQIFKGVEVPTAINADVKFLQEMIVNGKEVINEDGCVLGAFLKRNEETIVNAVYTAAYMRFNGLPYSFQDKTNAGGNPFGRAVNKDMAESPEKPKKSPKVTKEKVEVAA